MIHILIAFNIICAFVGRVINNFANFLNIFIPKATNLLYVRNAVLHNNICMGYDISKHTTLYFHFTPKDSVMIDTISSQNKQGRKQTAVFRLEVLYVW